MNTILLHVAQIGVFVFCFRLFVRNLDESLVKRQIKPELMPKIVTAFIFTAVLGAVFTEYFVFWMLLILVFGQIIVHFVQVFRNQRIENAVLILVKHIILNISAGNSFKNAYLRSVSAIDLSLQHPFKSIWDIQKLTSEEFPGVRTYKLSVIVRECRANSSSCLELMKQLRRHLQVEESFLIKIRAGLSQIRTQLGFISLFFLGMLVLLVRMKLHVEYKEWLFGSILLFILGSLCVWFLPRSFKWLD